MHDDIISRFDLHVNDLNLAIFLPFLCHFIFIYYFYIFHFIMYFISYNIYVKIIIMKGRSGDDIHMRKIPVYIPPLKRSGDLPGLRKTGGLINKNIRSIKMMFDKNQTNFPSEAHRTIWDAGRHILPLEIALPQEVRDKIPSYMADSCEQLQKYFLHILNDLYENPDVYEPFPHRQRLGIQSKFIMPFAEFGLAGEAGEDYMSINRSLFDKLFLKQIKSKAYHKNREVTISIEQRIKIFERTGLKVNYEGNEVILTNALYPNIFYAMREMALASLKEKGGGDNSFVYCDFRKLYKEYKYDKFENALVFLNDDDKNIAKQLDITAKKLKLIRSIKSGHCPGYNVTYKHKNSAVMELDAMSGDLTVSVRFLYDAKNTAPLYNLFDAIENDSDELKNFVYIRLLRCYRCYHGCAGYADAGFSMQIYGKANRMCLYTDRMGIYMPSKSSGKNSVEAGDIPMIEKIVGYIILYMKIKK